MDNEELERLKVGMVKKLLIKKSLNSYRFFKKYFVIAVDTTGLQNFKEQHCIKCLHKTKKKGKKAQFVITKKTLDKLENERVPKEIIDKLKLFKNKVYQTYEEFEKQVAISLSMVDYKKYQSYIIKHSGNTKWFHHVLEAKLVTKNGFAISIATEWIENWETEYEKQDSELSAFLRLSEKIKTLFKRLPICIVADGLYPNRTFFDRCRKFAWEHITTFKDGNLPSIWNKVESTYPEMLNEGCCEQPEKKTTQRYYAWINAIYYKDHKISWINCLEETYSSSKQTKEITRFVYLCSFAVNFSNIKTLIGMGRLRQKIENEGFYTQKNLGYGLSHKYSRVSLQASKNDYQCLQIACIINQLVELGTNLSKVYDSKTTLKFLWVCLIGYMIYGHISVQKLDEISLRRIRYQFE